MLKHWHSLSDIDRVKARSAATTVANYTQIGTSIGLIVGWILAQRSQRSALKIANAFKPVEQPIAVVFPNGRAGAVDLSLEAIAIISDTLKPSRFRNIATHIFYMSGASILGAVCGGLIGFGFAGRQLREDMKSMARMASALNRSVTMAEEAEQTKVDETHISPIERRNSLEKHLQTRPDPKDLKDRHILLDTNAAPSLQSAAQELERQRATDSLKKGLEKRPERDELIERNILPDSNAAPAIQGQQKELEKHMRADSLEEKMKHRPKPEELIKDGILQADEDPTK
ncbi:MAG: hypothetical protein L6R38_006698 [Xanthoria sp. 2 TBL-2021]|nr:MAG: hypothetical protein L6R38_006698 [Xanthoria sp. 2 TBL-2021]